MTDEQRQDLTCIAAQFARYFAPWDICLPPDALHVGARGTLAHAGWTIMYLVARDGRGVYLDFYGSHRITNDRHVRLRAGEEAESLPAYLDHMVFPPDASPAVRARIEEEYFAYNRRIGRMLRDKGFLAGDLLRTAPKGVRLGRGARAFARAVREQPSGLAPGGRRRCLTACLPAVNYSVWLGLCSPQPIGLAQKVELGYNP